MGNSYGFNSEQKDTFDTLLSGVNVFLSGEAGTGKSYVLNKFIEHVGGKLNVMIVAPTGIAAINVGGVTIHRAFKVPVRLLTEKPKSIPSALRDVDTIICDEISMCRIDVFEYIAHTILSLNNMRRKNNKKPAQFIVTGDFFQLPPVIANREAELYKTYFSNSPRGFAFNSPYWNAFGFVNKVLHDVMRQSNPKMIHSLNRIRQGYTDGLRYFITNSASDEVDGGILLCGTNKKAQEVNSEKVQALQGKSVEYYAEVDGEVKESDKATGDLLELKVGARVMTIVNDMNGLYQNGSLGTVVDLSKESIEVELDNGNDAAIERYTWNIEDYAQENGKLVKKVVGTFSQFPLKLAYAITIHSSQGQTYDKMNLDPRCWDCGQLYVALSRVKSIENLFILGKYISPKYLVVSKEVKDFYGRIESGQMTVQQTEQQPMMQEKQLQSGQAEQGSMNVQPWRKYSYVGGQASEQESIQASEKPTIAFDDAKSVEVFNSMTPPYMIITLVGGDKVRVTISESGFEVDPE